VSPTDFLRLPQSLYSQPKDSREGGLYDAVTGVCRIVSVSVDGFLDEALSGIVVVGIVDGFPVPIEASSSKPDLVATDGGCREHHQTQKARQHEYAIRNPGLTQLAKRMYKLIN